MAPALLAPERIKAFFGANQVADMQAALADLAAACRSSSTAGSSPGLTESLQRKGVMICICLIATTSTSYTHGDVLVVTDGCSIYQTMIHCQCQTFVKACCHTGWCCRVGHAL
jgi:hypothetical protein